jgi:hypothetical protein
LSDVEAARRQLLEKGVSAGEVYHFERGVRRPGRGGRWNSFVSFADPDGNGWVVQERSPYMRASSSVGLGSTFEP